MYLAHFKQPVLCDLPATTCSSSRRKSTCIGFWITHWIAFYGIQKEGKQSVFDTFEEETVQTKVGDINCSKLCYRVCCIAKCIRYRYLCAYTYVLFSYKGADFRCNCFFLLQNLTETINNNQYVTGISIAFSRHF